VGVPVSAVYPSFWFSKVGNYATVLSVHSHDPLYHVIRPTSIRRCWAYNLLPIS